MSPDSLNRDRCCVHKQLIRIRPSCPRYPLVNHVVGARRARRPGGSGMAPCAVNANPRVAHLCVLEQLSLRQSLTADQLIVPGSSGGAIPPDDAALRAVAGAVRADPRLIAAQLRRAPAAVRSARGVEEERAAGVSLALVQPGRIGAGEDVDRIARKPGQRLVGRDPARRGHRETRVVQHQPGDRRRPGRGADATGGTEVHIEFTRSTNVTEASRLLPDERCPTAVPAVIVRPWRGSTVPSAGAISS